jgi:hypothetical protein
MVTPSNIKSKIRFSSAKNVEVIIDADADQLDEVNEKQEVSKQNDQMPIFSATNV